MAIYGYDRVQMEAAAEAAFDEVRRLDEMLSNYRPESEWSQVNREAAQTAGAGEPGVVRSAVRLPGLQPAQRRGFRYHGWPADEGLGVLQRHRASAAPGRSAWRR